MLSSMKIKILPLFIAILLCFFFTNCTTDYFFDSSNNTQHYSQEQIIPMVYCNQFNKNGFKGYLTAYYDWNNSQFNTDMAQLFLWKFPEEFSYPATSYIQVHSFSIKNNQFVFNKKPLNLEVVNDPTGNKIAFVTTIGHDFLEDIEFSLEELIKSHSFIIKDTKGWNGLSLTVFDVRNKPLQSIKVFIPPFPANPQTYLQYHNNEMMSLSLHPFNNLGKSESDKLFYEKSINWCQLANVNFDVPELEIQEGRSNNYDEIDSLVEDLSLILPLN